MKTALVFLALIALIVTACARNPPGPLRVIRIQHQEQLHSTANGGVDTLTSVWSFTTDGTNGALRHCPVKDDMTLEWHCSAPFALRAKHSTHIDWSKCFVPAETNQPPPFDQLDYVRHASAPAGGTDWVVSVTFPKGTLPTDRYVVPYDIFIFEPSAVPEGPAGPKFLATPNTNNQSVEATLVWESSIENQGNP